ncbi:hypothetical protein H9P43_003228 [Blastocladiella emersonii ATCC 22665]|nr:hypothetical protein H9P43_003228 [Blastocladiella emersonii ATCC 22665]
MLESTPALAAVVLVLLAAVLLGLLTLRRGASVARSGVGASGLAALVRGRRRTFADTVVLVGAASAGKSALLARLADPAADPPTTFASMAVTRAPVSLSSDLPSVPAVDCPGHARLAAETTKHLSLDTPPRACVVVVDAAAAHVPTTRRDAAERLAAALRAMDPAVLKTKSSKPRSEATRRVVIAAAKSDLPLAVSPAQLRGLLQDELHALRAARAASIGAMNRDDEDDALDGVVASSSSEEESEGEEGEGVRRRGPQAKKKKPLAKLNLADLGVEVVALSAKTGAGVDVLRDAVARAYSLPTSS